MWQKQEKIAVIIKKSYICGTDEIPKKNRLYWLDTIFYLSGKSQDFASGNQPEIQGNIIEENTLGYYSQAFGYNISMMSNHLLYETVASWLGTPYRYSGKSFTGIDCSGFVNMLYNKVFNIPLTGSAAELFNRVNLLKKNDLKEGDLVFFKIRKEEFLMLVFTSEKTNLPMPAHIMALLSAI